MAVGPPTVTQTSETRPAKTTTTAAGPRWTSASVELAAMEGGGGGGGCLWVQVRRGQCTRAEQPRSDGGKGVGEDGSERAEVSTNVVTVAAAGGNRHQRTCVRIKKRLGHLCKGQYMKEGIGKIRSCSIGWCMRFDESHFPYRVAHSPSLSLEEELVRRPREG